MPDSAFSPVSKVPFTPGVGLPQIVSVEYAYMLCMPADMAVSSAGHAPPEVLAGTIGVLGRLGFQDEMVLDSLARHLMPGVQQLKPEHITELVSDNIPLEVLVVTCSVGNHCLLHYGSA